MATSLDDECCWQLDQLRERDVSDWREETAAVVIRSGGASGPRFTAVDRGNNLIAPLIITGVSPAVGVVWFLADVVF